MTASSIDLKKGDYPSAWINIRGYLHSYLGVDFPMPCDPVRDIEISLNQAIALMNKYFPLEIALQEWDEKILYEKNIPIPQPIVEMLYETSFFENKTLRPTPLCRAERLEKKLELPPSVKLYYKNEAASPLGSHKPNTAIPQVYYAAQEGKEMAVSSTGAAQWGCALAFACQHVGIKSTIFMVKPSYYAKSARIERMKKWGSTIIPSPSMLTQVGKTALSNSHLSISAALSRSEAIDFVRSTDSAFFAMGSVLESVCMHQTVIGQEAKKQLDYLGELPDIVIGCNGGGSNFSGLSYPFMIDKICNHKNIRFISAESTSYPTLANGIYNYASWEGGVMPRLKMYSLSPEFASPPNHTVGLRSHGMSQSLSQIKNITFDQQPLLETTLVKPEEAIQAGKIFKETEGWFPAPESAHAIHVAIQEALVAKKDLHKPKIILFGLSGTGETEEYIYE
ncbi:MAG: TrpB-like pyridoxal phosphate-dependent enzyme [Planctomycetaceae bacterium]|jgi:tryptophan synthase beta chain|nr:TrpB-like pyridoxal phosphate-dependent enzyme [Planctomycetaceae bacterium]